MLKIPAIILVLSLTICGPVKAQGVFETVDVAVGGDIILGGNGILDNWSQTPGAALELHTPYYAGTLEAGARYLRYNEKSFPGSGFRSIFLFIGWRYPVYNAERFTIAPFLRLGNHFLYQDSAKKYFKPPATDPFIFHRDESEFAYEIGLRTEISVSDRFKIYTNTSYNRTLINIPFSVVHTTIGVSSTFTTPGWLKNFVR